MLNVGNELWLPRSRRQANLYLPYGLFDGIEGVARKRIGGRLRKSRQADQSEKYQKEKYQKDGKRDMIKWTGVFAPRGNMRPNGCFQAGRFGAQAHIDSHAQGSNVIYPDAQTVCIVWIARQGNFRLDAARQRIEAILQGFSKRHLGSEQIAGKIQFLDRASIAVLAHIDDCIEPGLKLGGMFRVLGIAVFR